jgi:hypothetical protein
VLSLTSALFGFLMKQWLKMYISWTDVSPLQDAVGLRQYRYEGMLRWQLPNIFTMLPVLLQVALILFLIGLVDFLVHLQFEVALVVSIVIGVCLAAVVVTSILPSLVPTCPFRSPLSHVLLQARIRSMTFLKSLRWIWSKRWWSFRLRWNIDDGSWQQHWRDLDLLRLKREDGERLTVCDAHIRSVHYLWTVCQDETVLKGISTCLYEPQPDGRRRMPLERCWPVVTALRGFHGPRGLAITWRLIGRAGAMPVALRQVLARMLLDAAASEHSQRADDDPIRTKRMDDTLRLLSVLLFRVNDAGVIADYLALLHHVIPSRLDEVAAAPFSETSVFVPMTMLLHGIVYRCDKIRWQSSGECARGYTVKALRAQTCTSDASKFVRSAASTARECQSRLIGGLFLDFVQLALSVAVACHFDSPQASVQDSEALRDVLWIIERLVDKGMKGFDADRMNQWLDRFRHPLHVLLERNRSILPVPLACNLALNVGYDFVLDGLPPTEAWERLQHHLVSTCIHPGCQAKDNQQHIPSYDTLSASYASHPRRASTGAQTSVKVPTRAGTALL